MVGKRLTSAAARLFGHRPAFWFGVWALAYNTTHHLGLLPEGLSSAGGGTRTADWIDLAVPLLVLGPALMTLVAAAADRIAWVVGLLGAGLYAQGHGIHLAANSISNARGDAAPVHLWDEVVGHLLWYGGLALVLVALCRAMGPTGMPSSTAASALAVLSGLTWATNGLGADGLALPALFVATAFLVRGWTWRTTSGGLLLLTGSLTSVVALSVVLSAG